MRRIFLAACCTGAAVLAAAGCGSVRPGAPSTPDTVAAGGTSGTGSTAKAATSAPSASSLPSTPSGTRTGAPACPQGAWAYKVTDGGQVAWRASLPAGSSDNVQPAVAGGVAVFASGNHLTGLRLADGHQLWRKTFPQPKNTVDGTVYGLWTWHGSVIAQVGQVGHQDRVLSLDPAAGTVNWTYRVGGRGLLGGQALTADGVLAMLTPRGVLEGLDLATGRLLWSHRYGTSNTSPVAAGTVIVAATGSTVTGFADRTGRVLWTRRGMSAQPVLLAVPGSGQVLVYDDSQQVSPPVPLFPVTALSAATGKTSWRMPAKSPVSAVWAATGAVAIAAWGNGDYRLYLVNPVTGAVRWSVGTHATSYPALAFTATDVAYIRAKPQTTATPPPGQVAIVDRNLATGAVRWSMPMAGAPDMTSSPDGNLAAPPGPNLLVTSSPATPTASSRLLTIDGATGRARVHATLPGSFQAQFAVVGNAALFESALPGCAIASAGTAG